MAVPVASPYNRPGADAGLGKPRPLIPVPPKRGVEFRFQKLLDEAANAAPHPGFQRIEPIIPKEKRPFGSIRWRLYGIRFHGVISIGALTSIQFEANKLEITPPSNSNHSCDGAPKWLSVFS